MAPQYKLTYFNVQGLGEPIRYLLSYGNLAFEDNRVTHEEFPKLKPTLPFGKLPVLEENGKIISQSGAIGRYLAKKVGLAGKTEWDQLQADIAVDTFGDFRQFYSSWYREANEAAKAEKMKDILEVQNPFYLGRFDKQVQENGGYLVNGQLTWADLFLATFLEGLAKRAGAENLLAPYKNLQALKDKVDNLPGIKEYRAKRPHTDF